MLTGKVRGWSVATSESQTKICLKRNDLPIAVDSIARANVAIAGDGVRDRITHSRFEY
jgi:hypothetical protein